MCQTDSGTLHMSITSAVRNVKSVPSDHDRDVILFLALILERPEEMMRSIDQSRQPIRGAQHYTRNARKMAPFSRVSAYNCSTTRKPLICQFWKNMHLISTVLSVSCEEVKNCATYCTKRLRRRFVFHGFVG